MSESVYPPIVAFAGLALLLILSLPVGGIQKSVLTIYSLGLRLVVLAILGGAAYLWFRPEQLPVEVTNAVQGWPWLASILPEPGSRHFAVCTGALFVLTLLPLLTVLDVTRKAAGRRPEGGRSSPASEEQSLSVPAQPTVRRVDRRTAAAALAESRRSNAVQSV